MVPVGLVVAPGGGGGFAPTLEGIAMFGAAVPRAPVGASFAEAGIPGMAPRESMPDGPAASTARGSSDTPGRSFALGRAVAKELEGAWTAGSSLAGDRRPRTTSATATAATTANAIPASADAAIATPRARRPSAPPVPASAPPVVAGAKPESHDAPDLRAAP